MNAMVLAAGRGTRLSSMGFTVPKALVEVGGQPLLGHQLDYLQRNGVGRVVVNAHHQSEAIESFIAEYAGALAVTVVVEETLLGTAGGVRNAERHLGDDPFFVLYGDVIVDQALPPIMAAHRRDGAAATLTVYASDDVEGKGTVELDCDGRVAAFAEKARTAGPGLVNAGLYVIEPDLLAGVGPGVASDFGHDVFPAALAAGRGLNTFRLDAPVIDMGTPEGLAQARRRLAKA